MQRRDVLVAGAAGTACVAGLTPAAHSGPAGRRSFDFLHGRWEVRHRQLRHRLVADHEWLEFPGALEVQPILGGAGNFDQNQLEHPFGPYQAHSLRLFDPLSARWSIWWLDSRAPDLGEPVVGGFTDSKGTFYSDEALNGQAVRVRTTYEPLSSRTARWTQAFSPDAGGSWEVNWVMDFRRPA